jgi:hypothetical protein
MMRRPLQVASHINGHGYDDDHVHIMRVPTESGVRQSPPRYSYSTHCGWIDWDHAETDLPATLITRIREASARLAAVPRGGRAAPGATGPGRVVGPRMESRAAGILLSGVTPIAYLRRPLNEAEILRVALSIFMLQSVGFEALQAWTQLIGQSSFSEEDLPSNMIGFYMNVRRFDRARIEQMCRVWNVADSLRRFRGYRFRQNRTFRPLSLPSGGRWPAALATIRPAVPNGPLFGFEATILETPFGRQRYRLGQSGQPAQRKPLSGPMSSDWIQRLAIRTEGSPPNRWRRVPRGEVQRLEAARSIVERVVGWRRCRQYVLENHPGSNTLRQAFDRAQLWKNPSTERGAYGAGDQPGTNISYTNLAYRMGRWTLAATIVHELMHNCGVENEETCEGAVTACGRLPTVPVGQRDARPMEFEGVTIAVIRPGARLEFFQREVRRLSGRQDLAFLDMVGRGRPYACWGGNIFVDPGDAFWSSASREQVQALARQAARDCFRARR